MTTFTPAPKPAPRSPRIAKRISPCSEKQLATRKAAGEKVIVSTIKPKTEKQFKPRHAVSINRKKRKPLKKQNAERVSRRRSQYAKKLAAYRRSETYKIVEARAGGRCERTVRDYSVMFDREVPLRCNASRAMGFKLTHNHKTYARFGGNELPEDIELLCDYHNAQYESQKRPQNKNRFGSGKAVRP